MADQSSAGSSSSTRAPSPHTRLTSAAPARTLALRLRGLTRLRREGGEPPSLRRQGVRSYVFSAAGLGVNVLTGMMLARALDPTGRGELASILNLPQFVGILAAFSCSQAIAFGLARRSSEGSQLLGTWLLILIGMAAVGIGVGERLVPTLLGAQDPETVRLARIFMLMVVVVIATEIIYGMLLGSQQFRAYNVLRLAQPAAVGVLYAGLWLWGALTVESALLATVIGTLPITAAMSWRILREHGVARPSPPVLKSTVWYATRTHGATFGGLANSRMDVLLIPAFLGARDVGLYAVATSIAWMVIVVSAQFAIIVMPLAVRQGLRGRRTIVKAAHATLWFGVASGLVIAVLADLAIRVVYGSAFDDAASLVRILLPGAALLAVSGVVGQGLNALDRPFVGIVPTLAGAATTAVGIALLVDRGGATAIAACWSASQVLVVAGLSVLYRRAAGLAWSDLLPTRSDLRALARLKAAG